MTKTSVNCRGLEKEVDGTNPAAAFDNSSSTLYDSKGSRDHSRFPLSLDKKHQDGLGCEGLFAFNADAIDFIQEGFGLEI